jgi:hypothetical protein
MGGDGEVYVLSKSTVQDPKMAALSPRHLLRNNPRRPAIPGNAMLLNGVRNPPIGRLARLA